MKKVFKIMPEYGTGPIWISSNSDIFQSVDITELDINQTLGDKINNWNDSFQNTLNQDYPPDSGFSTHLEELEFEYTGIYIWECLQSRYLDTFEVIYESILFNKLFFKIQDLKLELAKIY